MDQSAREQLLERFRAYLEQAPDGRDGQVASASEAPDLFTLLSELAGLKNEVRHESRHLKSALEEFRALFERLSTANDRLAAELERRDQAEREIAQQVDRDLLLELLDLRDRLQAGHEQAERYRPGWLARRGGAREFVAALAEGGAMTLRRLDDTLARRGVAPLPVVGRPFDPQTMQVGEIVQDPARDDGEVVAERRRGFLRHDRLLRPAEVIVNRRERN
ncbi:nucleotide exchange factor GrpE [Thiococcus pfennigii]|uniref:nucleotide exchange factor GrpE n=1 Tax=Thiococcus pfennigii TaxID=1057 RepID=UPI00190352C0|nr:nucleotide exchange factor GrpE [Thiococcus pfennigii]MBK1730327.1 nucleotide exchange factor GrpE [Thiococcus pfennigii]